jgi:hypothetical protein
MLNDVFVFADGGDVESMPEEKQEQFQEMRCGSMGRGSVYDSVAGERCGRSCSHIAASHCLS